MNPPLGIGWEIWIGIAAILIAVIIPSVAIIRWTGKLDEWKSGLDNWKKDVDTTLNGLKEDKWRLHSDFEIMKESVDAIKTSVEAIETELVKSIKNGMVGYHSPFVASPKAIEVLERINLLTEIDANYSYIVEKVNERSNLPIYSDIKGMERRFIEIAPGVIHELIRAGKVEEKKIDIAMEELGKIFKPSAASYYGVLLVITAYILEKVREKGYPADVSLVYSQIDAMGSDSPNELLETFGGDLNRAIESYETAVRTLGEIDADELAQKQATLAFWYDEAGRKDEALEQLKEAIARKPDYAKAHYNLGILLNNLKRYDEVEEEYREAIRANPDFAEAHANLGIFLSTLDRKEEAIQEFNIALNLKDQLPDKGERIMQVLESLKPSQS